MKPVKLEEIIPAKPEFFIKSMGKVYTLRPPNLEDQIWISERYPAQADIARIFANREWKEICVMVYRHLCDEGRTDFKPRKGVRKSDDGHDVELMLTGPEVLLVNLAGIEESATMMAAMIRAMIISKPEMEEFVATEVKKNWPQLQQSLQSQQIGRKSSTPSRRNMVGRKRK